VRLDGHSKRVSLNAAVPQGSMIWLYRLCIGDKREMIALAKAVTLRQGRTRPRNPSLLSNSKVTMEE
jgi:hypothetical protein